MNARTINAPECMICDDAGVVPGKEVFSAALCSCSSGQSLAGGVQRMSAEHHAGAVGILALPSSAPEFTFGAISIDRQGLSYRGVRIEDAGRAYRTLMAVLHNKEPNPDDRPPRSPTVDVRLHDLALLLERMGIALATVSPNHSLLGEAEAMLVRFGLKKQWPKPHLNGFTLERRDDPHNPSNRHNPLNMGRRRNDRKDE